MLYRNFKEEEMRNLETIKIVEGIPPLTLAKSKGKPLKDYKIYGNSYQRLPQEYQEVEYLTIQETNSTWASIDFNIRWMDVSKIKFKGKIYSTEDNQMLFTTQEGGNPYISLTRSNGITSTAVPEKTILKDLEWHEIEITFQPNEISSHIRMRHWDRSWDYLLSVAYVDFYGVDNTLIGSFIPCYRKSDNVIGMYDLVENKFYANSGTGTFEKGDDIIPTPEKPIEIESVGEKTKNLLSGEISQFDNIGGTGTTYNYFKLPDDNKTYTISVSLKDDSVDVSNYAFGVTKNGGNASGGFIWNISSNRITTQKITVSPDDYRFITIYPKGQSVLDLFLSKCNIQIEEGPNATAYEPYGHKIPVTVKTKNLFNKNNIISGYALDVTTGEFVENSNFGVIEFNDLDKNTNYTISGFNIPINQWTLRVLGYSNTYEGEITNKVIRNIDIRPLTFNTGNSSTIKIQLGIVGRQDLNLLQIEEGTTATPYEPYFNQITNIYLNEPLRRVGNYADYIDFKNQKVVRNIGKKIFDGTERWEVNNNYAADNNYGYLARNAITNPAAQLYNSEQNTYLSNTFEGILINNTHKMNNQMNVYSTNGSNTWVYVGVTFAQTLDEWKEWVRNNDFRLYYKLYTSSEETIELPNILTAKDTCILSVGTSVQPSNVWLKYIKR